MNKALEESCIAAIEEATREYRLLAVELEAKESRFMRVRWAILSLSNAFDVVVPPDVLATFSKTRKDVQRAVQRARVAAQASPPQEKP